MRLQRALNALRHPITEYQVQRAKRQYRSQHPQCALCDVKPSFFSRNNDVHHLIPVHVDRNKACDFRNLITFCRLHHWLIGHGKNFKKYNTKVYETVVALKRAYTYEAELKP